MNSAVSPLDADAAPLVEVHGLTIRFPIKDRTSPWRKAWLTAVEDVDLSIGPGEAVGVVGESGCGKSTLARAIAGLIEVPYGSIKVAGATRHRPVRGREARVVQMVFQDPWSSLNPRRSVRSVLEEILRVHRVGTTRQAIQGRLAELMQQVELPVWVLDRHPRDLSGGQRQRVGIARALAAEPKVLLLDEAIAALDVSVQASVLHTLHSLRESLGLTMLFISHDLSAVRSLCDRVIVMYLGRVVEQGPVREILREPRHPYSRALLAAEPSVGDRRPPGQSGLTGEPPSAIDRPAGCPFHPRCPNVGPGCDLEVPLLEPQAAHAVACFYPISEVTKAVPA